MTFGGVTTISESGATISPPSAARTIPTTTTSPVVITTTTKVAVPKEEIGMAGQLELSMIVSRGSDSSAQ